jgi:hypothetical protein
VAAVPLAFPLLFAPAQGRDPPSPRSFSPSFKSQRVSGPSEVSQGQSYFANGQSNRDTTTDRFRDGSLESVSGRIQDWWRNYHWSGTKGTH